MNMNKSVLRFCIVAGVAAISGCKGSDAPKVPLGSAPPPTAGANQPVAPVSGEARVALDSGNILFRAKAYDLALAQYSRSADLAPTEVAPLLGILMVADITKNTKLAAATLPRIRKLDPTMADSSTVSSHSKLMQSHPKVGSPPST
jgi:hypothetical protein